MRYFREEIAGTYEAVRLTLNAAWGLPDGKGTVTCVAPESEALRDPQGRIVVAIKDFFCDWEPATTMLPELIAHGDISEITAEQYRQAIEKPTP